MERILMITILTLIALSVFTSGLAGFLIAGGSVDLGNPVELLRLWLQR